MSLRSPAVAQILPRSILTIALIVTLGHPAPAQVTETVDVRIIQVPVVVTRFAKPVTGLTREDFVVYVNGERQPVAYFDVVEFEPATQVVEGDGQRKPLHRSQRRLTLLVFDLANSSFINILRARGDVERLVREAPSNDLLAVATYSGGGRAAYLVPFTRDRMAIMRAVATLQRSRAADALALALSSAERDSAFDLSQSVPSLYDTESRHTEDLREGLLDFERTISSFEAAHPGTHGPPSVLDNARRDQAWADQTRATSWADAMAALADDLRPLEGIKQVVLFADGAGIGNGTVQEFASSARKMHQRFRAAGAVLNVVDVAGLRAPRTGVEKVRGGSDTGHRTPDVLFHAALDTGGTVFHGTGVVNQLRLLAETRSVTYLLGIRPPPAEREQNEIRIELEGQPMLTDLSYRKGYSREALSTAEVTGLLLADVMQNEIRRDDLTLRMKIRSLEPAVVDLGIPGSELLGYAVDGSVSLELFVYAFDESNMPVAWKHRRVKLDAEKLRGELSAGHFIVREQFELGPGRYTLRALVHLVGMDRLGFVRRDVHVPPKAR